MPKKILIFFLMLVLISLNPLLGKGASSWIYPETVLIATNLTGNVTFLQDHVSSPDGNWFTATSASAGTRLEVRLQSPSSLLKTGADLQKVQLLIRKNATGGNNPTVRADLYQNLAGVKTQIATTSQTVGDGNVLVTLSFDATNLPNRNGESLEVVMTGTPAGSGGPQTKRTVEVGAITFDPIFEKGPAPSNFRLEELATDSVLFYWDKESNVDHYELRRNDAVIYTGTHAQYRDTGLNESTDYTYVLRSFNGVNYSEDAVLSITTMNRNDWKKVSAGENSFALKHNGILWGWGQNTIGQMGLGSIDTTPRTRPIKIGDEKDWVHISSNRNHTLAVKKEGTSWGWGNNGQGQLGIGGILRTPTITKEPYHNDWEVVETGANFTVALKKNGTLWGWGTLDVKDTIAKQIGSDSDWKEISVGSHALAIKQDGSLWAWGVNTNGQLGLGDTMQRIAPTLVGAIGEWKEVSSGDGFSLAIKQDGTLWAWGKNTNGELGLGTLSQHMTPMQVGDDADWKDISAGANHSLAIKYDDTLWAWGLNTNGRLGLGDTVQRTVPTQVGNETSWKDISAGANHSLAIKYNGTLWAWGLNTNGRLGVGDTVQRTVPTEVIADTIPPSEVSEVAYRYTANGVELTWKNPSDADFEAVRIYRNETLITSTANELFLDDWLGAVSGNQTYRLATVDSNGNESVGVVTEVMAKLNAPGGFHLSERSSNSMTLAWDGVSEATTYKLYRGDDLIYDGTETTYTDLNKTPDTLYQYRLYAYRNEEQGFPVTVEGYTLLDTPVLETELIQHNKITLSWSNVQGATSYELIRNGEVIYTGSAFTYEDTGVEGDTQYDYAIKALNENTESEAVILSVKTPEEGYLSFTPPAILSDFEPITIDGTTQTRTATLGNITIKDTRSQSSSWTLSVAATPFIEKGTGEATKTLTTETFALAGIASITEKSGTFTALQTLLNEGDKSSITGTGVEILKAESGGSIGEFDILFPTPTLELKIQTDSIIAPNLPITYESTLIWTINVGP